MRTAPLLVVVLCWILVCLRVAPATEAAHVSNREIVIDAFERWVEGTGTPFEFLADDATWTILGPTPTAGTYSLKRLREEILSPFQARLATPLVPVVRAIHADGDTVIVLFEGTARLVDGERYVNSYAWFFRFERGQVRAVTAVLDLTAFDRVVGRTPRTGS
ncbi:nuclear transport factor 2 family protein [Congregicoccus parvus]|uniref:nuclear transport factor 2 family protein n=1 Tax=Congregicoccus parvus TaxID=3081749 RepID=UPI003FA5EDF5